MRMHVMDETALHYLIENHDTVFEMMTQIEIKTRKSNGRRRFIE